ncbi:MAG: DUF1801 domain-containing protein [Coriobacteriia bacterium]|nr:DUF1801 domain-containing protein [Coriobacteriia bacterium]
MPVKNPELLPLFDELRALLQPYSEGLVVQQPEPGRYELWSTVNVAPPDKPERRPYFVGLIIQKSYVGLYYMPIYSDPEITSRLGADLIATLKGKSCFYMKALPPKLRGQIEEALRLGHDLYRSKGWL